MSTESSTGCGTADNAEDTSSDVETVFDNVDGVDVLQFLIGDGGGVISGCMWERKWGGICEREEDMYICVYMRD